MDGPLRLSDETLGDHLRRLGIASAEDRVEVAPAGDGNINWVRRATLFGAERRSCIVKQARPALERFPEYQAPTERMLCEARYLKRARRSDLAGVLPKVLAFDAPNRLLVLEDLGTAERLDAALARQAEVGAALGELARFLGRVHAETRDDASLAADFSNEGMQRLHGDHIFVVPYAENDFALPPRTAERGAALRRDTSLVEIAARAYHRYLEPRGALVHGDVQAGNVLLPSGGVKLLDAEIAHVGDPAFDLGMLLGHRLLPDAARGRATAARQALAACWDAYRDAHGRAGLLELPDALRYAGLELLRRTLGAARVAAVADDVAGLHVIEVGAALVRTPTLDSL